MADAAIPLYWSAGDGKGWPQQMVLDMLAERFEFPDRPGYLWPWGAPFMTNRNGARPFVITTDEHKATVAWLAGEDVAYLPNLLPSPCEPPPGYVDQWASASGDPWLRGVF